MSYKQALLKHLFDSLDSINDVRMKSISFLLRKQLENLTEEQAEKIVLYAKRIIEEIEADLSAPAKRKQGGRGRKNG